MTNLFAEYKEIICGQLGVKSVRGSATPILFDINNVRKYVESLGGGRILSNDQVPDLSIDNTWFEFLGALSTIVGVWAIRIDENWQRYIVFSQKHYEATGQIYLGIVDINRDNNKSAWVWDNRRKFNPKYTVIGDDLQDILDQFIVESVMTCIYATTFAHCKNVIYYEMECPPKLQKKRIKKGKTPQETYRVLDIGGLQKQAKSESTKERGELQTALHICRGHFKTYTKEKPLMGKFTGTYWWPMHKRGSSEHGTVHKDYKLTT